jgi:glutamine synthetase
VTGLLSLEDLARPGAGLDTVIIAGVDMQGRLFGKRMSPRVFAAKASDGLQVCSCVFAWDIDQSLDGLHVDFAGPHTGWHDFQLIPDLATLRHAAWLDSTAIVLADCRSDDGEPLAVSPRAVLQRQVEALADRGLRAAVATELEFYLYRGTPADLRADGYRDLRPTTLARADYMITEGNAMEPFFGDLRRALDASDIPVEVAQAEYGLGQWEINLEYGDPVTMADRHVLFKQAVKDRAAQHGLTATFMPRPHTDDLGSSCHIHVSLWDGDDGAAFHDPSEPRGVSAALRHAIGGVLDHAPDLMCWYAPTVNSYRRTSSQDFAGNGLTWGFDNRTTSVRVVAGSPSAQRLEFRVPGSDVNPYLALAGVLASVRAGIDAEADPGPAHSGDAYAVQAGALPATLAESAERFGASAFTVETFGPDVVAHYRAVASYEWSEFLRSVTDWDRQRYLEGI